MSRPLGEIPTVYLRPGEWFSGQDRVLVKTVLGSCVSVTMFHRNTHLAAICHALMPTCEEKRGCSGDCDSRPRYADCITRKMAEVFFKRGFKPWEIEVKLFGGADSLSVDSGKRGSLRMGTRNYVQAWETIEKEGLRLGISHVGGTRGRKLLFDTFTGEVLLRRLHPRTDTGTGEFIMEEIARGIGKAGRAG
jgi:chemotaxis protein CheD